MINQPKLQFNDEELLLKLKAGNTDAFSVVYNQYWESLSVVAYKVVKDHNIAQDLVQDVFVDLWQKRHKKIINNLEGYLYQSIKYRVFKYIRESKKTPEYLDKFNSFIIDNSLENDIAFKDLQYSIQISLQSLPEKCRKIFVLSRMENKSHQEIADFFEISPKTVENQIGRALRHLKQAIYVILIFLFIS